METLSSPKGTQKPSSLPPSEQTETEEFTKAVSCLDEFQKREAVLRKMISRQNQQWRPGWPIKEIN